MPPQRTSNLNLSDVASSLNTGGSGTQGATGPTGPTGPPGATGAPGIGFDPLISLSGTASNTPQTSHIFPVDRHSSLSAFKSGMYVKVYRIDNPLDFMTGTITNYSGTSVSFTSEYSEGTNQGSFTGWIITYFGRLICCNFL